MVLVGSVSYTAKRGLSSVRSCIIELPFGGVRYNANWRQVYIWSCTVHIDKINLVPVGGVSHTAEWRLGGVRSYITESRFGNVRYTANWCQVYFGSSTVHIRQNKLGASWQCILHHQWRLQCKILHRGVAVWRFKIHRQTVTARCK